METATEAERPTHAPYGKACLNCVKSKTRCAESDSEAKCERCRRLNKDCQPAPTVRKKRVSKRPTPLASSVSKTAALEDKPDGIVQMLQRSQAIQTQAAPTSSTEGVVQFPGQIYSTNNDSIEFNNLNFVLNVAQTSSKTTPGPPTPATSYTSNPPDHMFSCLDGPSPASYVSRKYPLETGGELEEYLQTYRTKLVPYFPIVPLEENTTVQSISEGRPFLWLVIRAVCSKSSARQRALELEARKTLGKEMLIEGARNLDLLLGALVFAAWGHYFVTSKPIISPIIQLSMSLAFDLGLTKPIPTDPVTVMLNFNSQGCPKPVFSGINIVRKMEERRAAIGLFLISSIYANFFGRIEPLSWTSYLDECLQLLEEKMDFRTDSILIHLVRIQMLCNKVAVIPWKHTPVPQSFYVKTFQSELETLKRSVSQDLKLNETLQLATFHTVIVIHEHSLDPSPPSTTELERIDSLWACLSATKSWFTLFFSLDVIPLFRYPQVSMPIFNQFAHCLIVLFRLSTFESPGVQWDRKKVRQEIDLGQMVKLMASRWEEVATAAGLDQGLMNQIMSPTSDPDEGPWAYTRKKLLVVAHFWETKLASMVQIEEGGPATAQSNNLSDFVTLDQQQVEGMDFSNMGFLNNIWIGDLSGVELGGPYF